MCSAAPPSVIRSHVQHRTGHSYMLSSPAPAVRWFIIALKFSQQSARHFFTRPQFRPTRNVGEWEQSHSRAQSGSSHSRAVFLHCPDTTTGSGQPQKTGWNYLIFYTARPRRLLTLSSSSPLSQVSLFTPAAASPSFSLFLVCPSARCVEVSTNFRESFHSSVLSKVHTVTFTLKNILKHCSVVRSG